MNAGRDVPSLAKQDEPKAKTKKTSKLAAEAVPQVQLEAQADLDSEKTAAEPEVADKPRKSQESPVTIGDLSALTVPKLRELAKQRGISVPSKARKADIIEAIESASTD